MRGLAVLAALAVAGCSGCHTKPPPPPPYACAAFASDPAPTPVGSCKLAVAGKGASVRAFAVTSRQELAKHPDYLSYCEGFDRIMREDVAPCLAADKPNLVAFAEDAGLAAAFLGQRGEKARAETTALGAFLALADAYTPAVAHYGAEFPATSISRQLTLAVADTTFRAVEGTFAGIARRYHVYVTVGANLPLLAEATDATARRKLGDPEAKDGHVWQAQDGNLHNVGLFYDPSGKEIGRERKAYLTPVEEGLLDLSYGELAALDPVVLPFGRVGVAISKDAWMPPVRDRFDAWGVDLVVQHEAFSGWTIEEEPGDWLPEVFMESAWQHTARAGSARATVTPCLTGNLADMVFDGQSNVTVRPRAADAPLSFVGDSPGWGFAAIGPWAAPGADSMSRDDLRAFGQTLLPGGSRANQYFEGAVAADLSLGALPAASGEPTAPRLSPSDLPQRHPAIATRGALPVVVAWEEGGPGGGEIRFAVSDGAVASAAEKVSGAGKARLPALAFDGAGRLAAVWEEETGSDGGRVFLAVADDGRHFGAPVAVPDRGAAQWAPALAGDPSGAGFYLAWVDLADGPPHVYAWKAGAAAAVRVDPAHASPNTRAHEWSPAIAADAAGPLVAWLDFRDYSWDVRFARSSDGGASFAASVRVNDPAKIVTPAGGTAHELERLHADVALLLDAGQPAVAWTAQQDRRPMPGIAVDRFAAGQPGTDDAIANADGTTALFGPALLPGRVLFVTADGQAQRYQVTDGVGAVIATEPEGGHIASVRAAPLATGFAVAFEEDSLGRPAVRLQIAP